MQGLGLWCRYKPAWCPLPIQALAPGWISSVASGFLSGFLSDFLSGNWISQWISLLWQGTQTSFFCFTGMKVRNYSYITFFPMHDVTLSLLLSALKFPRNTNCDILCVLSQKDKAEVRSVLSAGWEQDPLFQRKSLLSQKAVVLWNEKFSWPDLKKVAIILCAFIWRGEVFSSCLPPLVRSMHCSGRLQKEPCSLLGDWFRKDLPHVHFYIPLYLFFLHLFLFQLLPMCKRKKHVQVERIPLIVPKVRVLQGKWKECTFLIPLPKQTLGDPLPPLQPRPQLSFLLPFSPYSHIPMMELSVEGQRWLWTVDRTLHIPLGSQLCFPTLLHFVFIAQQRFSCSFNFLFPCCKA